MWLPFSPRLALHLPASFLSIRLCTRWTDYWLLKNRVLTNVAQWNSPSFPDPQNSYFRTVIKWKPDVMNQLSSHFGSFLAEVQNILFKVHGVGDWLHPRQSVTVPPSQSMLLLLTTLHKTQCPRSHLQNSRSKFKIPWVNLEFKKIPVFQFFSQL